MILLSVKVFFSLLQNSDAITSGNLNENDDPTPTQLLATPYDCSQRKDLRQFKLTRVQNCTQTPYDFEYTRIYAFVFLHTKAKRIKLFLHSATI